GAESLDIRDASAVGAAIRRARPDVVLHLAAATDVDRCEREPEWAHASNAAGTRNVAAACQAVDAPLVYISTGGVFDGEKPDAYVESDTPNPLNVYAIAKLAGERAVAELLPRSYIVRAGWM